MRAMTTSAPRSPFWLAPDQLVRVGLFVCVGMMIWAAGQQLFYALAIEGIEVRDDLFLGLDFLAFYTASDAFRAGDALAMYDRAQFEAALTAQSGMAEHHLLWQYPPTVWLVVWPLAWLPYKIAYCAWMGLTFALCAAALRGTELISGRGFWLLMASPVMAMVFILGQISFLTTALLITAVWFGGTRPVLAGIAAGLLTIKPQLGLLLPFCWMIAGYWRAFGIAAIVSLIMAAMATGIFGPESWSLFIDSVHRISSDFLHDGGATPARSMTTLVSQLRLWGVDVNMALMLHYTLAALVAGAVLWVWWRVRDQGARAAILCAAVPLISPYSYVYELAALILPLAWLAADAQTRGWLLAERFALATGGLLFLTERATLGVPGIQTNFILALAVLVLVLRRIAVRESALGLSVFRHRLQGEGV